jgi:ketosteroid isomerase-like protein
MNVDYAEAATLLDRYARALETYDGDMWVDLFTEEAEYHEDPFEPPLVGHNALRAYLLRAAEANEQSEFTVERHWVVGPTVLAAWHGSFIRRRDRARVRLAGFMTLEVADDGRVSRFREWWHARTAPSAGPAAGQA